MPRFLRVAVALVVVAGAACATATTANVATVPGIGIAADLRRSDYVILGNAEGKACADESCVLGSCNRKATLPGDDLLDGRMESSSLKNVSTARTDLGPLTFLLGLGKAGPSAATMAEKIALYKAIESIPTADAIITPRKRIDITKNEFLWLTSTTRACVTVVGKAVHIKTDAELAAKQ